MVCPICGCIPVIWHEVWITIGGVHRHAKEFRCACWGHLLYWEDFVMGTFICWA